MMNENLPIYGVQAAKLKEFSTSKKDMKAGSEYQPNEQHRIRSEDIYKPKTGSELSSATGSSGSAAGSFGSKGGNGLNPTSMGTSPVLGSGHGGEEFGEDYNPSTGFRDASKTLYARKGDTKVTLQDFVIKKVIGRGSFGKVFLVQKKGSQEVYAMKSLRKDVILDYDQVESTKLEKEILM